MVKLKFEKNEIGGWIVTEDGVNSENVFYETVGILTNEEKPSLIINEDFSGFLGLDEMKQIINFMEKN